jgi:hypothetical protein
MEMTMQTTEVKVTRTCPACHCPTHLWQDSSGSGWIHDRAVDEHLCWRENRAAYEDGTL